MAGVETYRRQQNLLALTEAASIAVLLERGNIASTERERVSFLNRHVHFKKGRILVLHAVSW